MKIEKVSYQKTYSIGPYLTEKIGFEASPTVESIRADNTFELETANVMLSNLEKMADEWHKKSHPHLYQEQNPLLKEVRQETPPIQQVQDREQAKVDIKKSIEESASLDELKGYKLLASMSIELTQSYMSKLKELTNGK